MRHYSFVVALVAALLTDTSLGFSVLPATTCKSVISSTKLNGFGKAFGDAFKNDDSLGKADNAGLKGVRPIQ